jgi:hypothetical protein
MAEFDPDAYLNKEDKKKKSGFDPDAYLKKTEPESALQTFGRSSASLADSALNALTGTLDYGAYALARAAGRSPEQATAETTSPKDVFGRAFGVTGTQGYEQAPLRQIGTAIGEGLQSSVIQPVAQTTGLPEGDVGNMLNSLMMGAGPAVPKVAGAVGRGAVNTGKAVVKAPVDVIKGAAGRATGYIAKPGETPTGYQVPSSRIPLGDTFIPPAEMARLEAGLPMSEGAVRPISELAPAPVLALSGGEIPASGQAMRAFGERIGETYSNPYTAAADIGSMFLTGGIPVLTGMRGALGIAQGAADAYLARKGFKSLSPEQQTILNQGGNPFIAPGAVKPSDIPQPIREAAAARVTPVQPQLGYSPTPTPQTIPMGGPGRRVNIEGESFNLPYEIDTSRVQPTGPRQVAPQPTIGPVAPETITPAPAVAPVESMLGQKLTPEQILAQIQARSGKKGAGIFETAGEAPPAPIDLGANRASFLDKINQHRAGLEETRAQNRETFSGTAENLGRGTEAERLARMTPAERSDYLFRQGLKSDTMTDAAVVKDMIDTTTNTGIRRNNKTNIVDNSVFDEFAADAGVLLDWSTAPDISKMGWADGRKAMSDWMYKQVKTPANDLGLDARTGGIRGQMRQMEEANKNIQPVNPAEEAAALNAAQERMKRLRGGSMEMMSNEATLGSRQNPFSDINMAWDEAILNKITSPASHDITYKLPDGVVSREIKQPGRIEHISYDPSTGSETSYITNIMGKHKEYVVRKSHRDGQVFESKTYAEKPEGFPRELGSPAPEPTMTKKEFMEEFAMARLSGDKLPTGTYIDGDYTIVKKPFRIYENLNPQQRKDFLKAGGVEQLSQRFETATGKVDVEYATKLAKQIKKAMNKMD